MDANPYFTFLDSQDHPRPLLLVAVSSIRTTPRMLSYGVYPGTGNQYDLYRYSGRHYVNQPLYGQAPFAAYHYVGTYRYPPAGNHADFSHTRPHTQLNTDIPSSIPSLAKRLNQELRSRNLWDDHLTECLDRPSDTIPAEASDIHTSMGKKVPQKKKQVGLHPIPAIMEDTPLSNHQQSQQNTQTNHNADEQSLDES